MSGELYRPIKCKDCTATIGLKELNSGDSFCAAPCMIKGSYKTKLPSANVTPTKPEKLAPVKASQSPCCHEEEICDEDLQQLGAGSSSIPNQNQSRSNILGNVSEATATGTSSKLAAEAPRKNTEGSTVRKGEGSTVPPNNKLKEKKSIENSEKTADDETPKKITVYPKKRLLGLTCQNMRFPHVELGVKKKGMRTEKMKEGEFFFLAVDQEEKLMELNGLVFKEVSKVQKNKPMPLHEIREGKVCIASFEEDLYRAEILTVDHNAEKCKVFFMDYGNASVCKFTELYNGDDKLFSDYPRYAIFCKWDAKQIDPNVQDKFRDDSIVIIPRKKICHGQYLVSIEEFDCELGEVELAV